MNIRPLVLLGFVLFSLCCWFGIYKAGQFGYQKVFASTSTEPVIKKIGAMVYVHHRERVYTASYEAGKRSFEVLVDERFGRKCAPRVEVGEAFTLDYRCDKNGNLDKIPDLFRKLDALPQPIIDDFTAFRDIADKYYATH